LDSMPAQYHGGCADVWKGTSHGREVAIKVPKLYRSGKREEVRRRFCKEVVMWSALRHPNVLPLLGVTTMPDGGFAMVSEWMTNGNVNEFMKKHSDADRLGLLLDSINGLIYLHGQGVIHGDLKGENILVDPDHHARIADFGLLRILSDKANFLSSISCPGGGTVQWMSPELLYPGGFNLKDSRPTKQSDIYAMGMVIYEVLSGQFPFPRCKEAVVIQKVLGGERPQRPQGPRGIWFRDGLWEMMELCWKAERDDRPSLNALRQCLESVRRPSVPPSPTPTVDEDVGTETDDLLDFTTCPSPIALSPS